MMAYRMRVWLKTKDGEVLDSGLRGPYSEADSPLSDMKKALRRDAKKRGKKVDYEFMRQQKIAVALGN